MKTLILCSDNDVSDQKAAEIISSAMVRDPELKRVVWHSNMGTTIQRIESRFDESDEALQERDVQFKAAIKAAQKAADRAVVIEANYLSLLKEVEEHSAWIKEQKKLAKPPKPPKKEKKDG